MKPVKIALAFALVGVPLVMGCSSDPGPDEPQTVVAGPRRAPGHDGDDKVMPDLPNSTGTAAMNSPTEGPVPVPWNPPGNPGNGLTPLPSTSGSQPDQPQAVPAEEHHHLYDEAVGETLKHHRNPF